MCFGPSQMSQCETMQLAIASHVAMYNDLVNYSDAPKLPTYTKHDDKSGHVQVQLVVTGAKYSTCSYMYMFLQTVEI